jgi:hypothetical protein
MSELKSEIDINNKNPKAPSHTVSKSSSKFKLLLITNILILVNFDINQNIFQLNSNNIFAFPVIKYFFT